MDLTDEQRREAGCIGGRDVIVIVKLRTKNPEDRYASAAEVRVDLARLMSSRETPTPAAEASWLFDPSWCFPSTITPAIPRRIPAVNDLLAAM